MKKILFAIFTIFLLQSCDDDDFIQNAHQVLDGGHQLKKINQKESKEWYLHGSFFLGIGEVNGGSTTNTNVSFCWKNNLNDYVFSETNLNHIKVRIDNVIKYPWVTFEFKSDIFEGHDDDTSNINNYYERCVSYVVVHCSEKDFLSDININQLK